MKKESCGHFRNQVDTRHSPQGERDVTLNRDNASFIDSVRGESREPLKLESRRSGFSNVKSLNAVSTRHPEFPLERLCSHKHEAFQLTFARNAQQHFLMREDVEVVASHYGLMIRGETEDAIDAATIVLRDLYGPSLRIGAPMVRYHDGTTFEQPWMGLSVRCAPEHYVDVKADLIARDASIVSSAVETAQCLIQARAPLAELLGYREDLDNLTAGSAKHSMWLSHDAPVESPPPDGQAA